MADTAEVQPAREPETAEAREQRGTRILKARGQRMLAAYAVSLIVWLIMRWPWPSALAPLGAIFGGLSVGYVLRRKLAPDLGWVDFLMQVAMFTWFMYLSARNWNACALALRHHAH